MTVYCLYDAQRRDPGYRDAPARHEDLFIYFFTYLFYFSDQAFFYHAIHNPSPKIDRSATCY